MSQIEYLREKLHMAMGTGSPEDVLKISQELDKLIVCYMESTMGIKAQT